MKNSELYTTMCPIFWIGRLSGLFPFTNNFHISFFWSLFPSALFGVLTANLYFFYLYTKEFDGFSEMIYFFLCFTMYISAIALAFLCFFIGVLYKKVMTGMAELEAFLLQLGVQFKYYTGTIILDIGFRVVFFSIFCIYNHNIYQDRIQITLRTVGFYLAHWCVNCVEMQIVALCIHLSTLVKSMISSLPSSYFEEFLEASTSLVEILEDIHQIFSKPSFIVAGAAFMCTTIDLYILVVVFPEMKSNPIAWVALARAAFRCYELWRIVSVASSLSDEAKKLDAKLYTLALEDPTNQLSKKRRVIIYFSMKQKIEITACGLFPMNYALIYSVVTAITNYLVILVQLGLNQ